MTREALVTELAARLATPRPLNPGLEALGAQLVARSAEASPLASVLIGLYDPALEAPWLQALWPSTRLVVMTTAASLGASPELRRELLAQLGWLRNAFPPPAMTGGRLWHLTTPLAAFHWTMWRLAMCGKAGMYVVVAGIVHARVRQLERTMLTQRDRFGHRLDRNVYDYLRSARVFCRYGPRLQEVPRSLRRELLNAARFPA
jgi:hypothetical protein